MMDFVGPIVASRLSSASSAQRANETLRDGKTEVLAALIREHVQRPIRRALVVGCGSGAEAAVLAAELQAEVIGVDLETAFDPAAAAIADLRQGDATCLEFADQSFDFVYSYHALEHIPNCNRALLEMHRVLAAGGAYCIGTPNRLRVIGYLGSKDATYAQMLAWNVADWKAQLRGRFRNEYGAHAGFSSPELRQMLVRVFGDTTEITLQYYLGVYRSHATWVNLLAKWSLGRFLFPAIYFVGKA
jgi:ubiquinone/menaquinone biosynthesis C-methylase UbiE